MSKNTSNWYDGDNPQRQAVSIYRKPETEHKEYIMEDLLEFIVRDYDGHNLSGEYYLQEELDQLANQLKPIIEAFQGYKIKDVQKGEQELLIRWIEATKGS